MLAISLASDITLSSPRVKRGERGSSNMDGIKLRVPSTSDAERDSLVELSRHDLEQARIRAMRRAATAMLAVAAVLSVLVAGLLIAVAVGLAQLNTHLGAISETLSPDTISVAVGSVTHALDRAAKSSDNILDLTADAGTVGERLVVAANETVNLLYTANSLGNSLLAHPSITMALGQATPPVG